MPALGAPSANRVSGSDIHEIRMRERFNPDNNSQTRLNILTQNYSIFCTEQSVVLVLQAVGKKMCSTGMPTAIFASI